MLTRWSVPNVAFIIPLFNAGEGGLELLTSSSQCPTLHKIKSAFLPEISEFLFMIKDALIPK